MVYEIKRNYGDACPEPQEAQLADVKAGMLASVLEELRGVMQEVITKHVVRFIIVCEKQFFGEKRNWIFFF